MRNITPMYRLVFLIVLSIILTNQVKAQPNFKVQEDSLAMLIGKVAQEKDSAPRLKLNEQFKQYLRKVLQQEKAFDYPFDMVPYTYKAKSKDGLVRFITWSVPISGEPYFYGFLMHKAKKRNRVADIIELKAKKYTREELEKGTFRVDEWPGALYTEILQEHDKEQKITYYTLLGLMLRSEEINRRVIDVLTIKNDSLIFGAPIFMMKNDIQNRVLFEYGVETIMDVSYHKKLDMITFPRLIPLYRILRGQHQHYITGEYFDGLKFQGGKWNLEEDIDIPSTIKAGRNIHGRVRR